MSPPCCVISPPGHEACRRPPGAIMTASTNKRRRRMTFGPGEIDPSQSHGGGSRRAAPRRPRQSGHLQPPRTQPHSRSLWPQGRRRRMARLRHRFPERPRGVFGLPPHLGSAALPHRKKSEAGAPPGRLQRDLGDRPDRAPRPRTRPRAARDRQIGWRWWRASCVVSAGHGRKLARGPGIVALRRSAARPRRARAASAACRASGRI